MEAAEPSEPFERRIVYIRSQDRPALFFRVIGGEFHPVLAVYDSVGHEYYGYALAVGDRVKISIDGHEKICIINEFIDLTEVPEAFEKVRFAPTKTPR